MSTDKELREKAYSSEFQRLRINILYTANWLNTQDREFLKPYGITTKQFNILRILRGHKGKTALSILEIKQKMIDHMSDVSRLIDRLMKKDLILRKNCEVDRRTIRIAITKDGLRLLSKIDEFIPKLDEVFLNITEEDAIVLNKGLNKLRVEE